MTARIYQVAARNVGEVVGAWLIWHNGEWAMPWVVMLLVTVEPDEVQLMLNPTCRGEGGIDAPRQVSDVPWKRNFWVMRIR